MRVKGLHDVATSQNVHARPKADTRVRWATELARLEREEERLTRELEIWSGQRERTLQKLAQIEQRQRQLRQSLFGEGLGVLAGHHRPGSVQEKGAKEDEGEARSGSEKDEGERWQTVPLEY
jgi:hypothetical protein